MGEQNNFISGRGKSGDPDLVLSRQGMGEQRDLIYGRGKSSDSALFSLMVYLLVGLVFIVAGLLSWVYNNYPAIADRLDLPFLPELSDITIAEHQGHFEFPPSAYQIQIQRKNLPFSNQAVIFWMDSDEYLEFMESTLCYAPESRLLNPEPLQWQLDRDKLELGIPEPMSIECFVENNSVTQMVLVHYSGDNKILVFIGVY